MEHRIIALLLCIVLPALIPIWGFATEHFARYWMVVLAVLLSILATSLCWSFFNKFPFLAKIRRLCYCLGLSALAAILFAIFFRYDGSFSGTSLPNFSFRFLPTTSVSQTHLPSPASKTVQLPNDGAPTPFGSNRDGVIPHIEINPNWSTSPPEVLWRLPFGIGISAFAVQEHFVVTTQLKGDDEYITCLNLATGSTIWEHTNPNQHFSEPMGGDGPRSTPVIHESRVYSLGATGILDCLDLKTGKLVWSQNILTKRENLTYALSGSPLILDNLIIVSGGKSSGLLAFDLEYGTPSWQFSESSGAYASPRLVTIHSTPQILHLHHDGVAGHDPQSGERLWNYAFGNDLPKAGQPLVLPDDRVLVTADYNQGTHLIQIEKDPAWSATQIWESSRLKTKFSSAQIRGNHAYGLDSARLACIDLNTGDRVWKDGRYGFGQNLLVGSHLLVQAEQGELILVEANPEEHRELARFPALSDKSWVPPTIAAPYCLLRSEAEITCLKLPLLAN